MFEMGKFIVLLSTHLKIKFKSKLIQTKFILVPSFITKTSSYDMIQTCLMQILVNKCLLYYDSLPFRRYRHHFVSWTVEQVNFHPKKRTRIAILRIQPFIHYVSHLDPSADPSCHWMSRKVMPEWISCRQK